MRPALLLSPSIVYAHRPGWLIFLQHFNLIRQSLSCNQPADLGQAFAAKFVNKKAENVKRHCRHGARSVVTSPLADVLLLPALREAGKLVKTGFRKVSARVRKARV